MKIKLIRDFWLTTLWAIIVFILSSISVNNFDKIPKFKIPHLDKYIHFTMYFVLTILLYRCFKQLNKKNIFTKYSYIITFFIAVIYGGLIEIMQEYIFIGRNMDLYDFLANCTGITSGLFLNLIFKKIKS